jgi:hypothetical protein
MGRLVMCEMLQMLQSCRHGPFCYFDALVQKTDTAAQAKATGVQFARPSRTIQSQHTPVLLNKPHFLLKLVTTQSAHPNY